MDLITSCTALLEEHINVSFQYNIAIIECKLTVPQLLILDLAHVQLQLYVSRANWLVLIYGN